MPICGSDLQHRRSFHVKFRAICFEFHLDSSHFHVLTELTPESGSLPSTASSQIADCITEPINNQEIEGDEKTVQILQIEPRNQFSWSDDKNALIGSTIKSIEEQPLNEQILKTPGEDNIQDNGDEEINSNSKPKLLKRGETFDRSQADANSKSPVDDGFFESIKNEFNRSLRNEKIRLQKSIDQQIIDSQVIKPPGNNGSVIDSIQDAQRAHPGQPNPNTLLGASFDLTQIKDEHGRTVLHLAAAKEQKRSTFYNMLEQASYLLPERDSKYRTIRDVAVANGIKSNLRVIDQFVLDKFVQQDTDYLRMLVLDGYSNLLEVVDSEGNDAIATLAKNNITSMDKFIHELALILVRSSLFGLIFVTNFVCRKIATNCILSFEMGTSKESMPSFARIRRLFWQRAKEVVLHSTWPCCLPILTLLKC